MEVGGVVCGVTWKWDVRGCKGVSLASPAARRAYYGSTYYGTTYYGSTYYGSTYYGSTYYWLYLLWLYLLLTRARSPGRAARATQPLVSIAIVSMT